MTETERNAGEAGIFVAGVVEDLLHQDLLDLVADLERCEGQDITGESGVDAVYEERRLAFRAGRREGFADRRVGGRGMDEPHQGGGEHINAAPQGPAHLFNGLHGTRLAIGGVDNAIGLQVEQGADIICAQDPGLLREIGDLGGVLPEFFGTKGMETHQFVVWMHDDMAQAVIADVSASPMNHPICHDPAPLYHRCSRIASMIDEFFSASGKRFRPSRG